MAGDFNKPALADTYSVFAQAVRDLTADMAKGLDPALSLGTTNIPTNAIRWNSASGYWEKYSGTVWSQLATTYAINVNTANAWSTGRTITLTSDVTGTSAAWTGSGNISFATTLASIITAAGPIGSATSVPIITVDAKGRVTALSSASIGTMAAQSATTFSIGDAGSAATLDLSNTSSVLKIPQSTTQAPTAEGSIGWDTNNDVLVIGDGAGTKVISPDNIATTLSSKTMSTGCTWNGNTIPILYGGTGATDAATVRSNLSLGSMATQAANSVSLTGGAISGVSITLVQSTTAAPTAEGLLEWDTDNDRLVIGTGAGTKTFTPDDLTTTLTNKTMGSGSVWNGSTIGVAYGGTGATTFTNGGILRGNTGSAISVASAADIVAAIGATAVTNAATCTGNAATAYGLSGNGDAAYGFGQTTSASGWTLTGGYYPWAFNYHTGLAFSAHSSYGGIRFSSQANYPTNGQATPTLHIINNDVQVNGSLVYTAARNGSISGSSTSCTGTSLYATTAGSVTGQANSATRSYSESESTSTIVSRNASGYVHAAYFNATGTFATTGAASGMATFTGGNGSDTYGRPYSAAAAAALLSGQSMNIAGSSTSCSGNAASATTAASCSGNAASATTAASCSGNAASATTAASCSGNAASATTAAATNTANSFQMNILGVGTAPSATAGEIRATNNITAYYSDERLKDIISIIPDALDKVCNLRGVIYTNNDVAETFGYDDKSEQVGLLTQDLEKVLPQVVTPAPFDIGQNEDGSEFSLSGENYMTARYERVIPLLVEAIKQLREEVVELRINK